MTVMEDMFLSAYSRGDKVLVRVKGEWVECEVLGLADFSLERDDNTQYNVLEMDVAGTGSATVRTISVTQRDMYPVLPDSVPTEVTVANGPTRCRHCDGEVETGATMVVSTLSYPRTGETHLWMYCGWACRLADDSPEDTLGEYRSLTERGGDV